MRILALHCTNTRQTSRALEALLADAAARDDVEVVHWELSDGVRYPFPWGFAQFFSLMPDCVQGRAPALQPPPPEVHGDFDLVVLAWPVWFLSPALPMAAFLASEHAALLRGKPVVSLVTCRNMWFNAGLEVHAAIERLGGRLLDVVVLMDRAPPWTTFITTPVWLLTGRKQIGSFPEAGIQPADFAGLAPLARAVADVLDAGRVPDEPMFAGLAPIAMQERYLFPELVLERVIFRPWAWLIGSLGRLAPPLKRPLGLVVFLGILASVLLALPLLLVTRILLVLTARSWLAGLRERALRPYGSARHGPAESP